MTKQLKNVLRFLHNLLVINTLEHIVRIDTLIEGLILSTFGALIGVVGYFVFLHVGLEMSAEVSLLAVFGYLTIFAYHWASYEEGKRKDASGVGKTCRLGLQGLALLATLVLFFASLDRAIGIVILSHSLRATLAAGYSALRALPGLVVLAVPLFVWEPLCALTPVDEIVKWWFK